MSAALDQVATDTLLLTLAHSAPHALSGKVRRSPHPSRPRAPRRAPCAVRAPPAGLKRVLQEGAECAAVTAGLWHVTLRIDGVERDYTPVSGGEELGCGVLRLLVKVLCRA